MDARSKNEVEAGAAQMVAGAMLPRPTESELAILRVLWLAGPSTVREVHAALGNATGYTTVLKLMQIMAEKGLVERDEQQRAHVYRATVAEEITQRQLTADFLQRAFGGSARRLMMQLVNGHASAEEINELRAMLDGLGAAGTTDGVEIPGEPGAGRGNAGGQR